MVTMKTFSFETLVLRDPPMEAWLIVENICHIGASQLSSSFPIIPHKKLGCMKTRLVISDQFMH